MFDISKKIKTLRIAEARGKLILSPNTINLFKEGKLPKGNPIEVAKVAAILSIKNVSNIIPYTHQVPIEHAEVNFEFFENFIEVKVKVKAIYKTGVEMEALLGVSIALLTLYDMLKMHDDKIYISEIKLVEKKGGKRDFKEEIEEKLKGVVIVISDSVFLGKKDDLSGKIIVERLKDEGIEVVDYKIIPDEIDEIVNSIKYYSDELKIDLIITTGGTGFSPRDNTPEAMLKVIEREIPGIPEAIRAYGQERTPYSMLSRAKSGIRGKTIIINLPGSKRGVQESLDALFPWVLHGFKMLWGGKHKND